MDLNQNVVTQAGFAFYCIKVCRTNMHICVRVSELLLQMSFLRASWIKFLLSRNKKVQREEESGLLGLKRSCTAGHGCWGNDCVRSWACVLDTALKEAARLHGAHRKPSWKSPRMITSEGKALEE